MRQFIPFDEVQPGDIVTIKSNVLYNGVVTEFTVTGEVYTSTMGDHWVGETPIYRDEFVEAYRVKELPTEPGTIINNVKTTFGISYAKAILDKEGIWRVPFKGVLAFIMPEEIKDWQ